jgi:hypothetical protein
VTIDLELQSKRGHETNDLPGDEMMNATEAKVQEWINANRSQFPPHADDSVVRQRAVREVSQAEISERREREYQAFLATPNGMMSMFN